MKSTFLAILMLLVLVSPGASAVSIGRPFALSASLRPGARFMHIRYLGALQLSTKTVDGYGAHGLSGLAWDADEKLLYAVSDRGYVLHLRPRFSRGILSGLDLIAAYPLRNRGGRRLTGPFADAEGLALRNGDNGRHGDSELIVSFEVHPRIISYRPDGRLLRSHALPAPLAKASAYRGRNAELESCMLHQRYGILTAPQIPLRGSPRNVETLYSLRGRQWHFKRLDPAHSDIVDMAPGRGDAVVLLERRYQSVFAPIIFNLRRIRLSQARADGSVPTEDLAELNNYRGWRVDNFEGLTLHHDHRYFMVSDDNGSALQRTLLVYFAIEAGPASPSAAKSAP